MDAYNIIEVIHYSMPHGSKYSDTYDGNHIAVLCYTSMVAYIASNVEMM